MLVKVIDIDNSFEVNINKKNCGSTKKKLEQIIKLLIQKKEKRMSVN